MRRSRVVLVSALVLLAAGCTDAGEPPIGLPTPASPSTQRSQPPQISEAHQRNAEIYRAVIRHLADEARSRGPIYILDRTNTGAGRVLDAPGDRRREIPEPVRSVLLDRLDRLKVRFVRARSAFAIGPSDCGVKNRGLILTLAPIVGKGKRVEVGAESFAGCKGGLWATYVVRERDGWEVTGTTGPFAIS